MTKIELLDIIDNYVWDWYEYGGSTEDNAIAIVAESFNRVTDAIDLLVEGSKKKWNF